MVLWPLLALTAVPILVHLFARVRPPIYQFSSVEFIQRIVRNQLRVRKPQEWLLLVLRTVLVAALVAVFLRPLLFAERRLGGLDEQRNVVILIDNTASMSYVDGGQTRLASAAAQASEIINGLSSRDAANIIWLTRKPTAAFPQLGRNLSFLQDQLRQVSGSCEAGDIPAALQLAREQLKGAQGSKEICIVSDFQQAAWQQMGVAVAEDTDLILVPVGHGEGANCTVSDLYTSPRRPLAGEEVEVFCEVSNFSPDAVQRTVHLSSGESRKSQEIHLKPWSRGNVVFRQRITDSADVLVHASIAGDDIRDGLPADDERRLDVEVRPNMEIGVVAGNPETARVWEHAFNALPWCKVRRIVANELNNRALDGLVLTGWKGDHEKDVRQLVATGCAVVCEPCRNDGVRALSPFYPDADDCTWQRNDKAETLQLADGEHKLFRIFTTGDYGSPAAGSYTGHFVSRKLNGNIRTLLTYADGQPALGIHKDHPNLFYWNMALEEQRSNLSKRPQFVALLGEMIQYSREQVSGRSLRQDFEPGEPLILNEAAATQDAIAVTYEDGTPVELDKAACSAGHIVSKPCSRPGIVRWQMDGKTAKRVVVNFPASESDLRSLPKELGEEGHAVLINAGRELSQLREGSSLWPYLLIFVIIAALAEGAILIWAQRS